MSAIDSRARFVVGIEHFNWCPIKCSMPKYEDYEKLCIRGVLLIFVGTDKSRI